MDKRRDWPVPDAVILKPIAFNLEEALEVEHLFRPNLLAISQNDARPGDVTIESRDAAVNILRFLRVWLDLPHSVFFTAVSYLDMFLSKMKVQEKYLKCLTLSCLHLANETEICQIDVNQLVKVTQSKCKSSDVLRMANIVKDKIKTHITNPPTTPADFLTLYIEILKHVAQKWEHIITKDLNQVKEKMLISLEVLLASSNTAYYRSSFLALIVFQNEIEKILAQGLPNKSVYYLGEVLQFLFVIREIQLKCKIKNAELKRCYLQVSKVTKQYETQSRQNRRQLSTNYYSIRRFNYHPNFQTIEE
ncbi:hypothetical protein ABEB36_011016 [Hypothenemus hampei]|uniref:Cyclin N-terminal domain-containing protein n=1 Tax=Hypothenemus hampei TaxID=57062 RepID=A0ABD1EDW4_HYPHA